MQNDPNNPMKPILAFMPDEVIQVQTLLETLVRSLRIVPGGGKIEEGYWSYIYHTVRGAPAPSWSNLPMRDFLHNGLGVETKLLQVTAPSETQGRRIMHPSATRTLLFDPTLDAETCKVQVLEQFGARIADFRMRVAHTSADNNPDIRWGIFLWSRKLDEFLYFEEQIREPDPNEFYAQFVDGKHRGNPTRNLHIFEKATDIKRYSVTMPDKGAKLQPYFDVPLAGRGSYIFSVPNDGRKPIWLTEETFNALQDTLTERDQSVDEWIVSILEKSRE